ncbi:MAG: hypothetical protein JNM75_13805 [Rhodospirillales bacterium]|nr:hypothetical protein [Rhodospirillales bacterium]
MTKLTVSSLTLAAALALVTPMTAVTAADPQPAAPSSESHMNAEDTYQNALTDCEMKENPDLRQQCKDKAMKDYQAQKKAMSASGKQKPKQY